MKFKIASFVILFVLANCIHGQIRFRVKDLNADSLTFIIPEKEGTEKINVLNLLSNVICRKNIDSSINLATQAIYLSEKIEYQKGLADGYFNLGNGYFLIDSLQPTISNYLKALRIYENIEPSEEFGNLCLQLSLVNYHAGRLDVTMEYVRLAKSIYDKTDDKTGKFQANFSLGLCKKDVRELDSAFYYYHKALTYLDLSRDQDQVAYVYNAIGLNHARQAGPNDTSSFNTTISWLKKGLELPEAGCNIRATLYLNLGYQFLGVNKEKGLEYLQLANNISDSCFDAYDNKSTISWLLGWVSYGQGDVDKAISLYEQGIKIAEERLLNFSINAYDEPVHAYNNRYYLKLDKQTIYGYLYNIYTELENYKKAHEYYVLSKQAEEEVFLVTNQNLITMLESISKDEKTGKQIDLLARDNELKELKIKQARMFNIGIAVVFIILVLVGFLLLRQNKFKNEHKTVVLEQKLLRLQMNPHFIFNSLADLQGFIWSKDSFTANEYLSSFSKLIRLILENSRKEFVPVEKEISAISNYLKLQSLRYKDKFEYHIDIDEEIDEEHMLIPPMLAQPFIENSIEHGILHKETPGHIEVKLFMDQNLINIEVIDDGIGFKKSSEIKQNKNIDHESLAMKITRERLLMIYKKYKQKIRFSITDILDDENNVAGARVSFAVPYSRI